MRAVIYLIVLICLFGSLFSQTAKQDLLRLNAAYNSYNKISYSSNYMMYGASDRKLVETYQFTYKKNGDNFLSKSKDEEFLVNGQYMIVVDRADKEIHLSRNADKRSAPLQKMINDKTNMPLYMDTLMSIYKSIQKINSTDPDVRAYKFEMVQGEYAFVDIFINVKKWLIKELIMYPVETTVVKGKDTQVMLKVEFSDYNLNPIFTNDFSELRFVDKKDGKFILKQNYSSYKLYDQTH